MSDLSWKRRVWKHKFYKKWVNWLIKKIALHIIKIGKNELVVTYHPNGIDHYQSCKSFEKEYCVRKKYWKGYIKNRGYRVLGVNEDEIYYEIIKMFLVSEMIFPFCK